MEEMFTNLKKRGKIQKTNETGGRIEKQMKMTEKSTNYKHGAKIQKQKKCREIQKLTKLIKNLKT